MKILNWDKFPIVLAIILYIFIFILRSQQGGWDIKLDLFPSVRQSLDQQISRFLPSPQAELLSGILLGNKKDLPGRFKLALRDTSTLHIVVVSGENLTMFAGVFISLAGLVKRRMVILFSIPLIIFFTVLTGGQVPVLRAAIMAILSYTAEIFGRQRDGVWVLAITVAAMLLVNPAWIIDLSFQLSILATAGVIIVSPVLAKRLKFLPSFVGQDLAVTTGAQLAVTPIIVQNFHQLSLTGIFANLLVGWTVPIIMVLGGVMLVTSVIWAGLAQAFGLLAGVFLTYFIYIVQFFASLPFAWEYFGEQVWVVWAGYYLILAGVLMAMNKAESSLKS